MRAIAAVRHARSVHLRSLRAPRARGLAGAASRAFSAGDGIPPLHGIPPPPPGMEGVFTEAEARQRVQSKTSQLPGDQGEIVFSQKTTREEQSSVLCRLAGELQEKGEAHWNDALAQYDLALEFDRRNTLALLNKACILRDSGKSEQGLELVRDAISRERAKAEDERSDELLAEMFAFCGWIFMEQRRLLRAQQALQQAQKLFASEEYESGVTYVNKMIGDLPAVGVLRGKQNLVELFAHLTSAIEAANLPIEIRESPIHGVGLFATRMIAKGSLIFADRPLGMTAPWTDRAELCRGCGRWSPPERDDAFHYVENASSKRASLTRAELEKVVRPQELQQLRDDVRRAQGLRTLTEAADLSTKDRTPCKECHSTYCGEEGCPGEHMHTALCGDRQFYDAASSAYHLFLESSEHSPAARLAGELLLGTAISGGESGRKGLYESLRAMIYVPNHDPVLSENDNRSREAILLALSAVLERDEERKEKVANDAKFRDGWETLMPWAEQPEWFVRLLSTIELNGVQLMLNVLSVYSKIGSDKVLHVDTRPSEHASALALFPLLSTINHSCDPNAEIVNDAHAPRWSMMNGVRVVASEHILPDQEIMLAYDKPLTTYAPEIPASSHARRQSLYEDRYFWCMCPSCMM